VSGSAAPVRGAQNASAPTTTATSQTPSPPQTDRISAVATGDSPAPDDAQASPPAEESSAPDATPGLSATTPERHAASPPVPIRAEEDRVSQEARAALFEVEQVMLRRWAQIRSLSGTTNTTFTRTTNPMTDQKGKGTYECLKRDGRLLVRSFHFNAIAGENQSEEIPWVVTGERYTKVSDGQFVYTVREDHETKTATKAVARYPHLLYVGGPSLLYLVRSLTELRQRPNVEIDGHDVVVFEGRPPGGDPRLFRFFLDTDAGILRRMTIEKPTVEQMFALDLSDVRFDVDFEDGHFTFTPPEGVEIEDLTRPRTTAPSPGSEPSSTTAPDPISAPKPDEDAP
jgi:outer membrane lipoprotein-sorting protein